MRPSYSSDSTTSWTTCLLTVVSAGGVSTTGGVLNLHPTRVATTIANRTVRPVCSISSNHDATPSLSETLAQLVRPLLHPAGMILSQEGNRLVGRVHTRRDRQVAGVGQ